MDAKVLSLLKELEKEKSIPSDLGLWNVSWEVGEFLSEMVLKYKPKLILEIGTSNGFSALWMAQAASSYGGKVYTIESCSKRYPLAQENFLKSGLDNIRLLKGHAPEIFSELDNIKIDMAFFDGTKKQYIEFYTGLKPFFSDNAILLADNVLSHPEPIKPYLDLVRKEHESSCLDLGTGIEMTIIK